MKWQEIRTHFPQQWLLVEAIQSRAEANKCPLEHLVVIGTFPTADAAQASRQRLQRLAPGCELYVFHTSQETLDVDWESIESQSVGKRDIDKPTNITITSNRNQVRISWKHVGVGARFVAISWVLFFVIVIFGEGDKQELFNACLAPLVILVLATFYYLLVWFNNEMVVQVDRTTLKTSWEGPIPCFYTVRMIPSVNIRQVYIKHWVSGGKIRTDYYDIYILTRYGHHDKFMTVDNGELALYLEQEIEHFLGIKDQAVRGEWRPAPYLWES
jgi:hypothetical protein